jgi:ABC-2 type transport system permease protein
VTILAPATASDRSWWKLFWHIFKYQNLIFLRNPFSAFFSLAFPLMFLILFGSLFGNEVVDEATGVRAVQFLVPSMVMFAMVSSTYINLSIIIAINRDDGVLKRVRGTPLRPSVYMAARIASAVFFALVAVLIQILAGVLIFDVQIIWRLVPAAVVTLLLGIACFCALGVAVASVIPNGETAPAVANATALPILFISGVFIPLDQAPSWVRAVGSVFPVRHNFLALRDTFDPFFEGLGFAWGHLAVVALWTLFGVVVAVRYFRWEPRVKG